MLVAYGFLGSLSIFPLMTDMELLFWGFEAVPRGAARSPESAR